MKMNRELLHELLDQLLNDVKKKKKFLITKIISSNKFYKMNYKHELKHITIMLTN